MLLRMNENQFISFCKPVHGLPVAGRNDISTAIIDSGEGSIKRDTEMW